MINHLDLSIIQSKVLSTCMKKCKKTQKTNVKQENNLSSNYIHFNSKYMCKLQNLFLLKQILYFRYHIILPHSNILSHLH